MSQSFTNLLYHLIFSTKDRQPLIKPDYEVRLYDYIGGIIRGCGGVSLGINGVEDHVHVLAKLRPDRAVSAVLRDLKANATGWLHDVFPDLKNFPGNVGMPLSPYISQTCDECSVTFNGRKSITRAFRSEKSSSNS